MKRRILFVVSLELALGALTWLALRPREPVYQGKGLSEWLAERYLGADRKQAVRQIGTNGIPTLLHMLRARDSQLKLQLVGLAERQRFMKLHFVSDVSVQNENAALGFQLLGASASYAVPDLIQISDENVSEVSQLSTIVSLGSIGPAASAAVPKLLRIVGDTNDTSCYVRYSAIGALGQIHADPELVVPALVKRLKDPDRDVRVDAAEALGEFGAAAKSAVPALIDLLNDPDLSVNQQAKQALRQINLGAVAKAGVL